MDNAAQVGGFDFITIIAISGVIVAITYPLIAYFTKRRRRIRALYEVGWKSSRRLKPKEILGIRAEFDHGYHKFYFEVEENKKLEKCIEEGKNVILVGNPLAGKSRTVLETLKNFDKCLNVIIPKISDITSVDFRVPFCLTHWRKKVVVLDDLNKYASKQNFTYLLNEFRRIDSEKLILIATCRTEPELNTLNNEILDMFDEKVIFGSFPEKNATVVAHRTGRPLPDRYDGNIGSIFVDLIAIKDRFRNANSDEKSILRAIKRMYLAGIYEGKEVFSIKQIKLVLEQINERKFNKIEFESLLNSISKQGFVTLMDGKLRIEETYLDRVIEDKIDLLENCNELLETFSEDPDALLNIGDRASDIGNISIERAALNKTAIKAYHICLEFWTFEKSEENYAMTQNKLGNAYRRLGDVENKDENCGLAIKAYNEALKVCTLERFPMNYATAQNNLGNAYGRISEVENIADNCGLAIKAYNEALKVRTLKQFPMDYAMTQNNLGNAYGMLASVDNKVESCRLAIKAYNETLKVYTLERFSRDYAATQDNLGIAYRRLGIVENKAENCGLAIKAHNEALKIRTFERFPMDYTTTQNNLGNAYLTLGDIEDNAENCMLAIKAYNEALKVRTLERFPIQYANTSSNLGVAYWILASSNDKEQNCKNAKKAFDEALKGFEKENLHDDIEKVKKILLGLVEFCKDDS
ncbi:MAG: tetratricopeptide repeat protein [candidate division Zixibacteria bacterium]